MLPKILYPTKSAQGPFSVEAVGYEKKEGEGIPRRHPACVKELARIPAEGVNTVYDVITYSSRKFGDRRCMGTRKLIKMHEETKMVKKFVDGKETEVPKKWFYFEKSGYSYMSFKEYETLVHQLGSGLRALGLKKGDKVQIFAATR